MPDILVPSIAGIFALVATLLASFAGGGASMVLFPMLLAFMPGSYISLFAISKIGATVMASTSGEMHFKKSRICLKIFGYLLFFGLLGTAVGTYFLQFQFNRTVFEGLLLLFLFFTVIYLLLNHHLGVKEGRERSSSHHLLIISGVFSFLINILNGIFGGTGIFITLFLVIVWRMNFIKAVGYTMMMYAFISFIQVAYLTFSESFSLSMAVAVVIGSFIGGWLGTRLQYLKGNLWVKRAAIIMMTAIGVKMLIGFF